MRSSQKNNRNRGKNNRNKSVGNVVNRVFDSAGPEGKVRGTPQQIIEKYEQLARDATTSGDRVMAENFHQHAEHYLRLLNSAQAEIAARNAEREAQQQAHREQREAQRARHREQREQREPSADNYQQPHADDQPVEASNSVETNSAPAMVEEVQINATPRSGLETIEPEDSPMGAVEEAQLSAERNIEAEQPVAEEKPARAPRRRRAPRRQAASDDAPNADGETLKVEKKAPRRRRKPAEPKVDSVSAETAPANPAPVTDME